MSGAGWIEHNGGPCPVDPYAMVEARRRNGKVYSGIAAFLVDRWSNAWEHRNPADHGEDVIAYRKASQ